jgi:diguanylate cyclase (GGDEF)-like protein
MYSSKINIVYHHSLFRTTAEKLAISQQEYFNLEKKYFTDPLTGVGSRPAFTQQINAAISKAQRSSSPLSLLMVDADHFKKTNDRYGHDAGDKTLQKLAGLFGELTREVDFVARWGGEEFMVVLPDTGLDAALALAECIRAGIGQAGDWPCEPVTVSIGAAQWQPGQDAAALINQADEALFRAKEGGRNRVSQ